jgi:hypothetical protein
MVPQRISTRKRKLTLKARQVDQEAHQAPEDDGEEQKQQPRRKKSKMATMKSGRVGSDSNPIDLSSTDDEKKTVPQVPMSTRKSASKTVKAELTLADRAASQEELDEAVEELNKANAQVMRSMGVEFSHSDNDDDEDDE